MATSRWWMRAATSSRSYVPCAIQKLASSQRFRSSTPITRGSTPMFRSVRRSWPAHRHVLSNIRLWTSSRNSRVSSIRRRALGEKSQRSASRRFSCSHRLRASFVWMNGGIRSSASPRSRGVAPSGRSAHILRPQRPRIFHQLADEIVHLLEPCPFAHRLIFKAHRVRYPPHGRGGDLACPGFQRFRQRPRPGDQDVEEIAFQRISRLAQRVERDGAFRFAALQLTHRGLGDSHPRCELPRAQAQSSADLVNPPSGGCLDPAEALEWAQDLVNLAAAKPHEPGIPFSSHKLSLIGSRSAYKL